MTAIKTCFHCGRAILPGSHYTAVIDQIERPMCCIGCQTVAELIAGSGMQSFYHLRENIEQAQPAVNSSQYRWENYDTAAIQNEFVSRISDAQSSITVLLEGIYCSACAWLIERSLLNINGVTNVQVNTTSKRVVIHWQHSQQNLSQLLSVLSGLGYEPRPVHFAETVNIMQEYRQALKRLAVAGFGMMQVMTYAIGLYAGEFHGIAPEIQQFLILVSMLVATAVVFYAGVPFFQHAYRDISRRHMGMDVPIALAIAAAYSASVYSVLFGDSSILYFDSAVMFIFFLSLSRTVGMLVRHKAINTRDALLNLMPAIVTVKRKEEVLTIPFNQIRYADQINIQQGDIVPADGVCDEITFLDESWLTGEALPKQKNIHNKILAGSKNHGDEFTLRVTHFGQQTALANVEQLLDAAQQSRPKNAMLANKVAAYFISAVLSLALCTAVFWWFIDHTRVFDIVLAILVVSCPCALSLAIPTTLMAASQFLSRQGILITKADCLEKLAGAKYWVFDKTGTLTKGSASIVKADTYHNKDKLHCLQIASALENKVTHSIASAFKHYTSEYQVTEYNVETGQGVQGVINGCSYRLGKPAWISNWCQDTALTSLTLNQNYTQVLLATQAELLAVFYVFDELRQDAGMLIQHLKSQGKHCMLLSGDHQAVVSKVAKELQIDNAQGDCLPYNKLTYLNEIRQQQADDNIVMVGDGINDGPVMAAADVAISMGSGSALAQSTADVIIAGDHLASIRTLLQIAKRSLVISQQNLYWAACYNLLALPLAASGYLSPWMAALGMSCSSLFVVINAARVSRQPSAINMTAAKSESLL